MNSSGNEIFEPILNKLSNNLLLVDAQGVILWYNDIAAKDLQRLFGKSVETGTSFFDFLPAALHQRVKDLIERALAGEKVGFERKLNYGGFDSWYTVNIKRIDDNGKLLGVLFETVDITETKEAQKDSLFANDVLNAVKHTANDSSILISPDGKLLWFNKLFAQLIKNLFNKEPQIGDDMDAYIVADAKQGYANNFPKALSGEYIEIEREIIVAPNTTRWYNIKYYPIYTAENEVRGVLFSSVDIDARKRYEEELQTSNNKLIAILNSINDGYVLLDENYDVVLFNKKAAIDTQGVLGKDLLEGSNVKDYLSENNAPRVLKYLSVVFAGKVVDYEEEIRNNGQSRWFQFRFFPVKNSEDKIYAVAIVISDISELKKNFHNLLIERKLFNQGPVVAFKWTSFKESSITKYVSSNITDVFGYEVEEVLGKSFLDFLHPEDLKWLGNFVLNPEASVIKHNAQKEAFADTAYRVRCKDGQYKWANDFSFLAEEPDGEKIVCGYLIDITERKKATLKLEETNTQLQTALERVNTQSKILEVTTNIIVLCDVKGRIEWVNSAFEKCTGYTIDEVKGKKPGEILQGPDTDPETVAFIRQSIKQENKIKVELVNYRKNGEKYWLELILEPIYDERGTLTAFLAIENDISERKEIERKLKERDERLKKFSFMTSHELRHEFAKILLLLENKELLIADGATDMDVLTEIEAAATTMNDIISKMNSQLFISEAPVVSFKLTEADEICLVDDDEIVCFINTKIIKMSLPDKKILTFNRVDDAIAHLKNSAPDTKRYIFLDLNMPFKTGWDFLDEYKNLESQNPVVLLTSSIDSVDRDKSKRYSEVISFLTKPLTTDKLEAFI